MALMNIGWLLGAGLPDFKAQAIRHRYGPVFKLTPEVVDGWTRIGVNRTDLQKVIERMCEDSRRIVPELKKYLGLSGNVDLSVYLTNKLSLERLCKAVCQIAVYVPELR